jgi:hypothetical protein
MPDFPVPPALGPTRSNGIPRGARTPLSTHNLRRVYQAEHAAESLAKGSRVVAVGRLQQRSWTDEDGSAQSTVEVVAEELGPSLRWATATTTRATRNSSQ